MALFSMKKRIFSLAFNKKCFKEEHSESHAIIVSLDHIGHRIGNVESVYVIDFLRMLWHGEVL